MPILKNGRIRNVRFDGERGSDPRADMRFVMACRRFFRPRGRFQIEQLYRAGNGGHVLAGFQTGDRLTYRAGMRVCLYCGRRVKRRDQLGQGMCVRQHGKGPVEYSYVCNRCLPALYRDVEQGAMRELKVNKGHAWERNKP